MTDTITKPRKPPVVRIEDIKEGDIIKVLNSVLGSSTWSAEVVAGKGTLNGVPCLFYFRRRDDYDNGVNGRLASVTYENIGGVVVGVKV